MYKRHLQTFSDHISTFLGREEKWNNGENKGKLQSSLFPILQMKEGFTDPVIQDVYFSI